MGGAISGIFGGGSAPSQPNVQVYQPSGTSNIDSSLQNLLGQNANSLSGASNPYAAYSPQFANLFNSVYSSPYASGYQNAANLAGTGYTNTGTAALNNSTALSGQLGTGLAAGNQILNTAMDPQQALYGQQLQNTTDAANVANSQYGLTGQQAAGNLNQATTNFNIDWQNNELQRQLQGLSGYDSNLSNIGAAGSNAAALGNTGAGSLTSGGSTPYAAGIGVAGNQQNALQSYIASLLGPVTSDQSTIGNLQNYLNTGVNASLAGASAALGDYKQQSQNTASLFGGLGGLLGLGTGGGNTVGGSALSGLSSLFGGGSSAAADDAELSDLIDMGSIFA